MASSSRQAPKNKFYLNIVLGSKINGLDTLSWTKTNYLWKKLLLRFHSSTSIAISSTSWLIRDT